MLKHQFTNYFGGETKSAELHYNFVKKLKDNWSDIESSVKVELLDFEDLLPTESRRRDYKQLLILVKALRQFRSNNVRPNINISNSPPSISNARWFGVREKMNWSFLKAYPFLCESALAAIERNEFGGDDVNCFTN